jgi:DNA mismatch endonuclease, patch repair protein
MDTLTPQERSERMRRVRSRDTRPELRLRRLVWSMGYRYRKSRRSVIGNPDIAFVSRKLAIFLHGCFWHRHDCPMGNRTPKSRVDFWRDKFDRNVRRDEEVMERLATAGWRVAIVWECELKNDPTLVEHRLRELLSA